MRSLRAALLFGVILVSSCRQQGDQETRNDATAGMHSVEVRIPSSSGIVLAGTLTRPAIDPTARVPVVMLIGGSGPQDRDGTRAELAGYQPFRDLAASLAAEGIATLRLDDRGTGGSSGRFDDATTLDFADDVAAALRWLRPRGDVDGARAALLGHSEGALVALIAAARDSSVSALVLLGAPSRTGRELARWQRAALVASDRVTFAPSERGALLSEAEANAERAAAGNAWLRVWFSLDPRTIARSTRAPALVLHGTNDRQVPVEQATELADALSSRRAGGTAQSRIDAPHVEVRRFPSTDHLFLEDHDGDPRGYVRLVSRRLRPEVTDAIAGWLRHRFGAIDSQHACVASDAALSSHHVRSRASEEKSCASE